jgi:hypothetical protein
MIRILHQNITDYSTLSATNVAGGYYADSLKNNIKGQYLQTTVNSTVITSTLTLADTVGMVALPKCNLTSSATMRVQLFSDAGGTVQIYDSGTQSGVVAAASVTYANYAPSPSGAAGWAFGGGNTALLWVTPTSNVRVVKVTVSDATVSVLQLCRLVCGGYTELSRDAAEGVSITNTLQSTQKRRRSGDISCTLLPQSRALKFDMHWLTNAERRILVDAFRTNGIFYPFFVSVQPTSSDNRDRADLSIFGFLTESSALSVTTFDTNASSVSIEEM